MELGFHTSLSGSEASNGVVRIVLHVGRRGGGRVSASTRGHDGGHEDGVELQRRGEEHVVTIAMDKLMRRYPHLAARWLHPGTRTLQSSAASSGQASQEVVEHTVHLYMPTPFFACIFSDALTCPP